MKRRLKKLENYILHIICVYIIFYNTGLYKRIIFYLLFWEISFPSFSVLWVFSACPEFLIWYLFFVELKTFIIVSINAIWPSVILQDKSYYKNLALTNISERTWSQRGFEFFLKKNINKEKCGTATECKIKIKIW